jgi:hypothetical protein
MRSSRDHPPPRAYCGAVPSAPQPGRAFHPSCIRAAGPWRGSRASQSGHEDGGATGPAPAPELASTDIVKDFLTGHMSVIVQSAMDNWVKQLISCRHDRRVTHERTKPAHQCLDISQVRSLEGAVGVARWERDHCGWHVCLHECCAVTTERSKYRMLDGNVRAGCHTLERRGGWECPCRLPHARAQR